MAVVLLVLLVLVSSAAVGVHLARQRPGADLTERLLIGITPPAIALAVLAGVAAVLQFSLAELDDTRLTPTIALLKGYPIYAGKDAGVQMDTMYGPLTHIVYLPAALLNTPVAAMLLAAVIAACFYFIPLAVLFVGRGFRPSASTWVCLAMLVGVVVSTFRSAALSQSALFVHADAPAIGLATLACLPVYLQGRMGKLRSYLLSSVLLTAAFWTKQIELPMAVGIAIFVLAKDGWKDAITYCLTFAAVAAGLSLVLAIAFGPWEALYFNTVQMIRGCAFKPSQIPQTLALLQDSFGVQYVLFGMVLLIYTGIWKTQGRGWRAVVQDHPWLLFAICAAIMLPPSVASFVKDGADINSLSPTLHLTAVALFLALGRLEAEPGLRRSVLAAAAAFIVCLAPGLLPKVAALPAAFKSLRDNSSQVAYNYSKRHPGQVYFPNNSLAVIQSEGRLHHPIQGLFTREVCGYPISLEHFRRGAPEGFTAVAMRGEHWYHQTLMRKYLPDFHHEVRLQELPGFRVFVRRSDDVENGALTASRLP